MVEAMTSLPSSSSSTKRPMVVEADDEDVWTLYPTPGFVAKFRDAKFLDAFRRNLLANVVPNTNCGTGVESTAKLFVNIAHCSELPGPARDLDEDEVAKSLSADENAFKLPLSVGELETTEDKRGESALKVDVLLNSNFYHKRIAKSEFFRQITLLLICDSIEQRHGIQLDSSKQVILQNRKFVGELSCQRIRKKPKHDFVEINAASNSNNDDVDEEMAGNAPLTSDHPYEALFENERKRPRNYRVQIVGGVFADIRVRIRDSTGDLVNDVNRVTLKMNDDRFVVLLDNAYAICDFFMPFRLLSEQSLCEFDVDRSSLIVKCPIDWNQSNAK